MNLDSKWESPAEHFGSEAEPDLVNRPCAGPRDGRMKMTCCKTWHPRGILGKMQRKMQGKWMDGWRENGGKMNGKWKENGRKCIGNSWETNGNEAMNEEMSGMKAG